MKILYQKQNVTKNVRIILYCTIDNFKKVLLYYYTKQEFLKYVDTTEMKDRLLKVEYIPILEFKT